MPNGTWINTKAANAIGWDTVTTGATVGTFTALPAHACDEVVLSVTTGTAVAAQISGSASPSTGAFNVLPTGTSLVVKTGGNSSNIFIGPSTAVAAVIGFQYVQYKPQL